MKSQLKQVQKLINFIRGKDLYPEIPIVNGPATEPRVVIGGEDYALFASNNYLGMSSHPAIKKATKEAVDIYGLGSGGPRLLSGNLDVHNDLEEAVAKYLNRESVICFTTGFMANIGVIPPMSEIPSIDPKSYIISRLTKKMGLVDSSKTSVVFSDEKNHGSIIDGIKLSNVDKEIYSHNDIIDLEKRLKKHKDKSKLIITDGVFSMDGDIAPLPEIVDLARKYEALLMVDDAHGIGILGKTGRGTLEHFGLSNDDVDILMGTFTKAFGGIGGFVTGSKAMIDYLKISARTYILSAPLPPSIAAGLTKSVAIVDKAHDRRKTAHSNAVYFKKRLQDIGYKTTNTDTLIVPVLIGDDMMAIKATKEMRERGIIAPNARFPAVAKGQSRLRFVMTSGHTKKDIDYLIKVLKDIKPLLKL